MYIVGVDTWEGQLEIDENLLLDAGVKYLIIRMNDMNGGHHMDSNFLVQWVQADKFLRAPYFVYNPWVDGKINAQYLLDHLPTGITRIFADIEVAYSNISPSKYASDVQVFVDQVKNYYPKLTIYTGPWFLGYLSTWPKNVDYWFARYPFYVYPDSKIKVSWDYITTRVNQLSWTPSYGVIAPGNVVLWQCTAERYILPGCSDRPIDINLYNDSLYNLQVWWGATLPPADYSMEYKVNKMWEVMKANGWV